MPCQFPTGKRGSDEWVRWVLCSTQTRNPNTQVPFLSCSGSLLVDTNILGLSFWELLMSLPHGTPSGIYLTGFWNLCQDFWAHHGISISNHREPLPHPLHTQELPFYWPNTSLQEPFQVHQLLLVPLSPLCSTVFQSSVKVLFNFFYFYSVVSQNDNIHNIYIYIYIYIYIL